MPADRHEENQRYWNKKKNDTEFMARRREKNRAASKRAREKKKLRATDDADKCKPDERHVYSPDLDSLEERAAIKEFDAGKEREVAEEEALNEHLDYDPDFDFF